MARIETNVNEETADALRRIMVERGVSVEEAIRRSVSVYAYIRSEAAAGKTFYVYDQDGGRVQFMLM